MVLRREDCKANGANRAGAGPHELFRAGGGPVISSGIQNTLDTHEVVGSDGRWQALLGTLGKGIWKEGWEFLVPVNLRTGD